MSFPCPMGPDVNNSSRPHNFREGPSDPQPLMFCTYCGEVRPFKVQPQTTQGTSAKASTPPWRP